MNSNFPPADCTACGACINVCPVEAISWSSARHRAEMPAVDASRCISCGQCVRTCPRNAPFAGTYPQKCFAAWLTDADELARSSSGGVARALARHILDLGGTVFGCAFTGGKVRHIEVGSMSELDLLSGSKYVWSDTERTFSAVRDKLKSSPETPVLYIGTPCQIDGLKHFLGNRQYDNLYLADLICHGVPPASYLTDYIRAEFGGEPESCSFRSRAGAVLSGRLKNGQTFAQKTEGTFSDPYLHSYVSALIYRENCHSCRYAAPERVSDLTLGDFWGIGRGKLPPDAPEICSVVFAGSPKGEKLLGECAPILKTVPIPVLEGICGKANLNAPSPRPADKDLFYTQLEKAGFRAAIKLVARRQYRKEHSLRSGVKNALKTLLQSSGQDRRPAQPAPASNGAKRRPAVRITTVNESFLLSDYGAFFQHFALREFLTRLGFAVYRHSWEPDVKRGPAQQLRWLLRHWISRDSAAALVSLLPGKKANAYARHRNFTRPLRFRRDYVKWIGPVREHSGRKPDFCLTGSGPVFSWRNMAGQFHRFLADAPQGSVKISYAAGADWQTAQASAAWRGSAAEALGSFRAISVRDETARKIIAGLVPHKDIAVTLDPVLLLHADDYERMIGKRRYFRKPVLLCWLDHCDENPLHLEAMERTAARLNVELKVIGGHGTERYVPLKYGISPSPEDLLRAVRDAEYIVTDSFYGTVFSILFHKQWAAMQDAAPDGAAQAELLAALGLSDRLIDFPEDALPALLEGKIDWTQADEKLETLRSRSSEWLKAALRREEPGKGAAAN